MLSLESQAAGPCTDYKILDDNDMTRVKRDTGSTSTHYCDDAVDPGEHSTNSNKERIPHIT